MSRSSPSFVSVCAVAALLAVVCGAGSVSAGPLWDYANAPDPTFGWVDTGYRLNNTDYTGYLLNLTSQSWLTPADTDRHVWTHQLMVFVPKDCMNYTIGFIYVTGGDNNDPKPPSPNGINEDVLFGAVVAVENKMVTATLWQVPNQPIVFAQDPTHSQRSEDAAVAFTWLEFIFHKDRDDFVLFFPMVKSVHSALTAIQQYVSSVHHVSLQKFVVAGASKRGWTTWLEGATDDRVIAIVPIVMDMLNFQKNVGHMFKAYGGWTFAFEDYYKLNITEYLETDLLPPLAALIDPLNYKENLTMPKLVVDATGDEFFMPDDDHYWWGMLEGETYRLMVANAEHSMATGILPLITGVVPFVNSVLHNTPRPVFDWTMDASAGTTTVNLKTKPLRAVMWTATTDNIDNGRRDFRLIKGDTPHDPCKFIAVSIFGKACVNPVLWDPEDLEIQDGGDGTYTVVASQDMPPAGAWRGFLVYLYFPGPAPGQTFLMTTQVNIIPDTFPFPMCQGTDCKGFLV